MTNPMTTRQGLPEVKWLIDLIQNRNVARQTLPLNRGDFLFPLVESQISAFYQARDGRFVVVIDGTLIERTILKPWGSDVGSSEIRYFSRESDAQRFWFANFDRICGKLEVA